MTSLVTQQQAVQSRTTWMDASLIASQIQEIKKIYTSIMTPGVHYGPAFPGSKKPSLLLPGAELLNLVFRIAMKPEVTITQLPGEHREYMVTTTATNAVTGEFLGSGLGSCSTMESKYRYRQAKLTCPECGTEAIIKGKEEFGGGWLCYKKNGGCGAKFKDKDRKIVKQERGRVENPDIADQYNTVLKIAKKRSMMDCCKTVTGASAFFSQDAEDFINADISGLIDPEPEPDPLDPLLIAEGKRLIQQGIDLGLYAKERMQMYDRMVVTRQTPSNGKPGEPLTDAKLKDIVQHMAEAIAKKQAEQIPPPSGEELVVWLDLVSDMDLDVEAFKKARDAQDWSTCRQLHAEAEAKVIMMEEVLEPDNHVVVEAGDNRPT